MGTFTVPVQISNLDRRQSVEVVALVDTGTTYTTLPLDIVTRLEIEQQGVRRFELGYNRIVEYPVGHARIILEGQEVITLVVFGP